MRVRVIVAVLVAVLVFYFVLLADRAFTLIGSGSAAGIALGVGVLLLPLIGVVLVVWELRFGYRTQQLGRRLAESETGSADALAAQDWPPAPELPKRPSGRVEREAADEYFETVKIKVEASPDDWRGWYRLAQAYDLAGDRKRARSSMRTAIELAGGRRP